MASNARCALSTRNATWAKPPRPPFLSIGLLHGRIRRQRLKQLNQVGPIANLKQSFAHLVCPKHFFAMNLAESEHLVCLHLAVQIALPSPQSQHDRQT